MSNPEHREFTEWRKRKAKDMADLAARVFALRSKGYIGCGFHWSMEKNLGVCIARLNDYDDGGYYHGQDAIAKQIILEVLVESLEEDVDKAEKGAL